MDGISTDNFKSIKQAARSVYDNAPNMAPARGVIHSAVKFCMLGSIPAVLGQDRKFGITEKGVILASVFGTVLGIGIAVGLVCAVSFCLQRSALDESGVLVVDGDEPVVGGPVIRSVDQEHAPQIREIFGDSSEHAPLQHQLEPSGYASMAKQSDIKILALT